MATSKCKYAWETENYIHQKTKWWPKYGKHILAQYDDDTIVVYQAFKPEIAQYAVENQKFGGEHFSFERMSWIKTNFLWMMYRCGWASKKNQERVLAVRITREGFEQILAKAYTAEFQKSEGMGKGNHSIEVRLQWDPDHSPSYGKLQRRAIQLGLKGEILRQYGTEWVVDIKDVTSFVKEQHSILQDKNKGQGKEAIETARERVYTMQNPDIVTRIELDHYDPEEHSKINVDDDQESDESTYKPDSTGEKKT